MQPTPTSHQFQRITRKRRRLIKISFQSWQILAPKLKEENGRFKKQQSKARNHLNLKPTLQLAEDLSKTQPLPKRIVTKPKSGSVISAKGSVSSTITRHQEDICQKLMVDQARHTHRRGLCERIELKRGLSLSLVRSFTLNNTPYTRAINEIALCLTYARLKQLLPSMDGEKGPYSAIDKNESSCKQWA